MSNAKESIHIEPAKLTTMRGEKRTRYYVEIPLPMIEKAERMKGKPLKVDIVEI